ncbi:uncharacterized protein LOC103860806 [Brassica rapa]|uniref:Uncharacterized protein n=2 Tax=Brassica campestris TaxID=3711 RepID=M4D8E9_BRACM|nr:uncharacterized protein LOC103860806 [Brassica rapa]
MGRCRNGEKRLKPYNLGRKMMRMRMRMRNLGSVCAKLGRSGTMMMNRKESTCGGGLKRMMNTERRRRCDSTGGDFEGGLRGALGTGWRTLARCSAFYFGYKFFGEYLRPYDHQYLYECIEEADSDVQTYLERINIAERSLDAVLNLEDKCFGPKH